MSDDIQTSTIAVTLYKDAFDKIGETRTIAKCLENIRTLPTLAKRIAELRPLYRKAEELRPFKDDGGEAKAAYERAKDAYDEAKKKLPAVTFSGTFTKRGIAGLAKYTGIIQADLDHLKEKGFDIGELESRVSLDLHVAFCFVSPSGDGLKIGIRVTTGAEHHMEAFLGMQRYFVATYGVKPDDACKDVSRLCFLSSDPALHINAHAIPLDWRAWPEPAAAEPNMEHEHESDDSALDLPLDALPDVIQRIAQSCADVYLVDVALPAVSALTILSAALGKSVECYGATSGKRTPANLPTVISAPSGYGKGVCGVIAKPYLEASAKLAAQFEENSRPNLRATISMAEARKKEILSKIKGEKLTASAKDEARAELAGLEREIEKSTFDARIAPALYVGSATGAALAMMLKRNNETLLSFALEAGDVIRIAAGRYTSDNKGDYDLLLSGYTGEPFAEGRVSRESPRLEAPCLSMLWAVQPSLCRELYGTQEAQERGLLARINVIQCDDDLCPLDDGIFREVPAALEAEWDNLICAALKLRASVRRTTFSATAGAREVFRQWHNVAVQMRNGECRESEAKLKRCRENAIRIALVIAAGEWLLAGAADAEPTLSAETAARGVAMANYFLHQTLRLTRGAVRERRQARLDELLAIVSEAGGAITLRELRRSYSFGDAEVTTIVAREPALLRIEATTTPKGGRRSPKLIAIRNAENRDTALPKPPILPKPASGGARAEVSAVSAELANGSNGK